MDKQDYLNMQLSEFMQQMILESCEKMGTDVAVAKRLGVDPATIGRWKRGEVSLAYCRIDKLSRIMGLLEVPMERLIEALFKEKGPALAVLAKEDKTFLEKLAVIIDNNGDKLEIIRKIINMPE